MFARFTEPRLREIFSQLRSVDGIISTDVEEIRMQRWASGRVALLGDAVHAMSPNIGQGAGMAMEDAAVLAQELASGRNIEQALSSYAGRRKQRAEMVVRVSRAVGEDGQKTNPVACWLRDRRIRRDGRNTAKMQAELERLLVFSE
jgi:2-polyprenyl-6-methoxyphenol hydroxylase-like FAD-dependent oxidoreductase